MTEGKRAWALWLDGDVTAGCNTNWLLPHQVARNLLAITKPEEACNAIACIPFESSRSWCVCLGAASLKPCLLPSSCECPCFHDTLPFSFLLFTAGDTLGSTYLSPCYSCSCPTPLPHFLDGYTCLLPFGLVLRTLAPLA